MPRSPIAIERTHVRKGIVDLDVCADVHALRVTSDQARRILELLPNLAHHVCVNGAGNDSFGDEVIGTELPHLLEHVVIELQGKVSGDDATLTGHTSWLDELGQTGPEGYALMRTSVTFKNDFVALHAIDEAVRIIDWMVRPEEHVRPDIDEVVFRLEAL